MKNLKNKVAFITGGSRGIGKGIAEALLEQGIQVAITGRTQSRLEETVSKWKNEFSAKSLGLKADVKNYEDLENAISKTIESFGKIDIIIANAGVGHFASIDQLSIEQWQDTIETNLSGVFYTLKAGFDQLKLNKGYFLRSEERRVGKECSFRWSRYQ